MGRYLRRTEQYRAASGKFSSLRCTKSRCQPRGPTPPYYGKEWEQLAEGQADSSRLPSRVGFLPGAASPGSGRLSGDKRGCQLCRRPLLRTNIPNFATASPGGSVLAPGSRLTFTPALSRPWPLCRPQLSWETPGAGTPGSPIPVPQLTLWTLKAQESESQASHSPLVKGSIFAPPWVLTSQAPQASYYESWSGPADWACPARPLRTGGEVRRGAAPLYRAATTPSFRVFATAAKRTHWGVDSERSSTPGLLGQEAREGRAGLGRGLCKPRPQRHTWGRGALSAAELYPGSNN